LTKTIGPPPSISAPSGRGVLAFFALLSGLAAAFIGAAVALFWLTRALPGASEDELPEVVAFFAVAALGLGLGLPLAFAAISAWRERPARLPGGLPGWVWLPATLLTVGVGAAVIASGHALTILLPPLHVLAIALPAVGVVSLASRRLAHTGISGRLVLGHFASGAYLVPLLALVLELVVGLLAGGLALVLIVLFIPGGAEQVRRAIEALRPLMEGQPLNTDELLKYILWPPFAVVALVFVSGLFPLLEEAIKPISAFVLASRLPTAGAAFLAGVAAGAGFGLSEGLLNGAWSLEEWSATVLLRAGGTAMHAFASGLVAWGWYRTWRARRPWPVLLAYGVAVALHGLWNALALVGGVGWAFTPTNASSQVGPLAGSLIGFLVFSPLVGMTLAATVGIVVLSGRLARDSEGATPS